MIDENASSSSHHEQVQANTTLRRIVENEVDERKDEHFELPNNRNPYLTPLEMEYEPKAHFPLNLKEPIEDVGVKSTSSMTPSNHCLRRSVSS
jgi:hypothetical protein